MSKTDSEILKGGTNTGGRAPLLQHVRIRIKLMNWIRVIKYCIILLIVTSVLAFSFSFIYVFLKQQGYPDPFWTSLGTGITVPIASIIIFTRLAYIQRLRPLNHALSVGIICWLISFLMNVLLLHQPVKNWATGLIVILMTAFVGVGIGNLLCNRSESKKIKA